MILGLNFQKAYHIGTYWMPDDSLYLILNGEPFAETEPIHDLNALIFCAETTIIPHFSNGYIPCKMPTVKRKAEIVFLNHLTNTDPHTLNAILMMAL